MVKLTEVLYIEHAGRRFALSGAANSRFSRRRRAKIHSKLALDAILI